MRKTSRRPRANPPMTAPPRLPRPPMSAARMPFSIGVSPKFGDVRPLRIRMNTLAIPASRPARANAPWITGRCAPPSAGRRRSPRRRRARRCRTSCAGPRRRGGQRDDGDAEGDEVEDLERTEPIVTVFVTHDGRSKDADVRRHEHDEQRRDHEVHAEGRQQHRGVGRRGPGGTRRTRSPPRQGRREDDERGDRPPARARQEQGVGDVRR